MNFVLFLIFTVILSSDFITIYITSRYSETVKEIKVKEDKVSAWCPSHRYTDTQILHLKRDKFVMNCGRTGKKTRSYFIYVV
jgi:hypothetical protein